VQHDDCALIFSTSSLFASAFSSSLSVSESFSAGAFFIRMLSIFCKYLLSKVVLSKSHKMMWWSSVRLVSSKYMIALQCESVMKSTNGYLVSHFTAL